jgi:hypothetical protein
MQDNRIIRDFAQAHIDRAMQALNLVLPHYDQSIREKLSDEQRFLLGTAEELDDSLNKLVGRCAAAKTAKPLVTEMRNLRIRGLRFFRFLHTSRRLLKITGRRLDLRARIEGLDGEATVLKLDLEMMETDLLMQRADELIGKAPKRIAWNDEVHLFVETTLLPFKSKLREVGFGLVHEKYAISMHEMILLLTRRIYKEQARSVSIVIWRVVQPFLIPLTVTFAVVYLIHLALESAGIHFLHVTLWGFSFLVLAYAFEKAFEYLFEEWHILRYRKSCLDTALSLYLAEIRARVALLGLIALSEGEPRLRGEGAEGEKRNASGTRGK